jgi:hypothetical protein
LYTLLGLLREAPIAMEKWECSTRLGMGFEQTQACRDEVHCLLGEASRWADKGATIALGSPELRLFLNAGRETLEAVEAWEYHARLGETREETRAVLNRLAEACGLIESKLAPTSSGDGLRLARLDVGRVCAESFFSWYDQVGPNSGSQELTELLFHAVSNRDNKARFKIMNQLLDSGASLLLEPYGPRVVGQLLSRIQDPLADAALVGRLLDLGANVNLDLGEESWSEDTVRPMEALLRDSAFSDGELEPVYRQLLSRPGLDCVTRNAHGDTVIDFASQLPNRSSVVPRLNAYVAAQPTGFGASEKPWASTLESIGYGTPGGPASRDINCMCAEAFLALHPEMLAEPCLVAGQLCTVKGEQLSYLLDYVMENPDSQSRSEIANRLLDMGARPARESDHLYVLHSLLDRIQEPRVDALLLKRLLSSGICVDIHDKRWGRPFEALIWNLDFSDEELEPLYVELLARPGLDLMSENRYGATVVDVAKAIPMRHRIVPRLQAYVAEHQA